MNDIKLETVYDYYDIPLNFTFRKREENGIFFGHFFDADDCGVDAYWVIQTSEALIHDAETQIIDLFALLTTPEGKEEITLVTTDGEEMTLDLKTALLLYEDLLPDAGTYLLNELHLPKKE